ncbi:hypothetical protein SDC9_95881 [bioreactor metagenome]|uniref:DUF1700 domain-containing protein n=1 Tax=bioreactor metagenome TaxID=1076179 RepID=A0A645AE90_9ZZZZ|nr:DUF1700 domain-containing protein [Christensenella sp.]
MTKLDYLNELKNELKKNGVVDSEDILSEYEQHFLFKLADGFPEEEIAAKLGSPETVAAQFAGIRQERKGTGGKKAFLVAGLAFLGILEGSLDLLFLGFILGLTGAALASAAIGAELILNVNFAGLLPPMPYAGALILGVMMLSLAVLLMIAALYCFAYLRQMVRASLRWRKNRLSEAALPPLPTSPQFSPKTRRAARSVFLGTLMVFGVSFVLGYLILGLYTHSWGFWHALGWFGYPPVVY